MDKLKKLKKTIEEYINVNRLEYAKTKYGLGKLSGLKVVLTYIEKELSENSDNGKSEKNPQCY